MEKGAINEREDNGKKYYSLSSLGKETLSMVEDNLLNFVKEKIMRSATRLLAFKKNGSTIHTDIEESNGGYILNCNIDNKKGSLLKLSMYLDNKEEAEIMKSGFDNRAENVYGGLLALLMGDFRYFTH